MGVIVNPCKKKSICHNYPKECGLCVISSDSVNPHPYFEERDLVEVVRCSDCRYYSTFACRTKDGYDGHCHGTNHGTHADGYCHFGKRKE